MSIAILSAAEPRRSLAHSESRYCVVDARPEEELARDHIPGAGWMGWEQWCERGPVERQHDLAQTIHNDQL